MSYCSESVHLFSKATSILSKGLTKGTRNLSKNKETQCGKNTSPEATRDANIQHFYFKIMSYVHQKYRDYLRTSAAQSTPFTLDINLVNDMGMRAIIEKDIEVAKAVLDKLRIELTKQNYTLTAWLDTGSQLKPFVLHVTSGQPIVTSPAN